MPNPSSRNSHPLLARARYITIGLVSAGVITTGVLYVTLEATDQASAQATTSTVIDYSTDGAASDGSTSGATSDGSTYGRVGSLTDAGNSSADAQTGAS